MPSTMRFSMRSVMRRRGDRGSVTAETAVAIPSLFLVVAISASVITAMGVQSRCGQAARVVAEAIARGESAADVATMETQTAPAGAQWDIERNDTSVVVRVRAALPVPLMRAVSVSGQATAINESVQP
jgi:Flp pilus assembly protein TadG